MSIEFISLSEKKKNTKYAGIYLKDVKGKTNYYISFRDENNKVKRKKLNINNLTDNKALQELNRVKEEIRKIKAGQFKDIKTERNKKQQFKSLEEMALYYFKMHQIEKKKIEINRYETHLKDEEFSKKIYALVDIDELKIWLKKMYKKKPGNIHNPASKKTLSPKTINNVITLAITIIRYAIKNEKYSGEVLFDKLEKPKVDNIRLKMMTEDEIRNYLKVLKNRAESTDNRYAYLYALLALTLGAREQTILNIKEEDIDFKTNIIKLYNYKTKTNYKGYIVSKEIAEEIKLKLFNGYLFYNFETEKQYIKAPSLVREILNQEINNYRDQDSKITVRDFRNVFATRLINQGVNLSYIQNLLNHKTMTMTSRYAQMLEDAGSEELRESFKGMEF